MNFFWLMRMARWVRNPPSVRQVVIVLATVAIAVVIVILGATGHWPDWARLDPGGMRHFRP